MAKAYIKCATQTCDNQITIIESSRKLADRKAAWYESKGELCSVCWKAEQDKKRTADLIVATEEAKKEELPELQGSEKQIAWATTIRHKVLSNIQLAYEGKAEDFYFSWNAIERLLGIKGLDALNEEVKNLKLDTFEERYAYKQEFLIRLLNSDRMLRALDSLQSKTSAHWWIDNRDFRASALLVEEYERTEPTPNNTPTQIIADAKAEATVRPESPITETVAEIQIVGQEIRVSFPEKVESFRLLMHKFNFDWRKGYWGRSLNSRNGTPENRAVEIGNAILNAGFIIRIYDADLRSRAVTAEFEPEHTSWVSKISKGEHDGWFAIMWGREDDYYAAAKKLPRSKYSKPFVVVPPEVFEEVMDFASLNGFMLTDTAKDAAEQAKANKEVALIAKATKPTKKSKSKPAPGKRPEKLEVEESGIDEDLKD